MDTLLMNVINHTLEGISRPNSESTTINSAFNANNDSRRVAFVGNVVLSYQIAHQRYIIILHVIPPIVFWFVLMHLYSQTYTWFFSMPPHSKASTSSHCRQHTKYTFKCMQYNHTHILLHLVQSALLRCASEPSEVWNRRKVKIMMLSQL